MKQQTESDKEMEEELLNKHEGSRKQKIILIIAAFMILISLFVFSIAVGALNISFREVLKSLFRMESASQKIVVWNIRLPRITAGILSGAGLAVAGAVMQSILKNPLGSPFTLGISQAAGFGAAFSIIILGTGTLQSGGDSAILLDQIHLTAISAFGWALVSTLFIVLLVRLKNASPETMILAGIALGSLFTAGTTALQYVADDVELAAIVFWTFGDVGRATWSNNGLILLLLLPCLVYFYLNSWNYKMMASGDETARSLGVPVKRLRLIGMLITSLITALIISFVGIIGFVGLVSPHIGRKLIGPDERFLLPFSALVGSILLLGADTAARTILSPIVLPVGILTSFLGVPLFLYLVVRGREYMWN
ncbi:FecCD family ABC transporter permease [Halarsenatibacter silvermanii]|uniref:Iron complex transport system permease protein n=1 Tax=Halarsenatibacter silvermanii TaxID=321763 RepID=A0A1G9S6H9_9FIRM|nr:iron ABC transporter permease [Halarsenatibacter silvermanii]SDM31086.1 iron complex transport system permease protein [Halarsenatibacter silvermanii]